MRAIESCRTAELGGHVEVCSACGFERVAYNSCRDRHCPKCQSLAKAEWLEARQAELLPVPYFHAVLQMIFQYRDRRQENQRKEMTLTAEEFIRRFLLHVLPNGFQRIRHFGFLANRRKKEKLARIRQLLGAASDAPAVAARTIQERMLQFTGVDITRGPACQQGSMVFLWEIPPPARPSRRSPTPQAEVLDSS